jgi:hypothetical protein
MKPFNPHLNKDITELKTLNIKKDKTAFKARVEELMKKYSISLPTIYRELKKDIPGSYTRQNHSAGTRAITEKEISMVKELLLKKIPVMDLGRIMEAETGEKYTWERIEKLRQIVDMRITESSSPLDAPFVTSFGYPIKCLVEKALKLDKIAPGSFIEFSAGEKTYHLTYSEARDIALICANAIMRINAGFEDDITYMKAKLRMLFREKIRTAPVQTSIKEYRNLKWELQAFVRECHEERDRRDKLNSN